MAAAETRTDTQPLGTFCLVLHGHLPYVLHHGTWPHGEDWLFEAAAETYLPLLAMLEECTFLNATPRMTIGLTPVLLEQLAHPHFQRGFADYLQNRRERAKADRAEFAAQGNDAMVALADRWIGIFDGLEQQFEALGRDLPRAFADFVERGCIELLTSNATHAYMPLMLTDTAIRAQIRAGLATSERLLGFRPGGMWFPECAYRPTGTWHPPVPWGQPHVRAGLEHLAADEGIHHFFVESDLVERARSEQSFDGGAWRKVGYEEAAKYPDRWRSVNRAHGVNSDGTGLARLWVMGRDREVCERVWSGTIGYPADGAYLEFHKQWGAKRGLRYWRITGKDAGLGQKELYEPEAIQAKVHQHAAHFCDAVKAALRRHRQVTGEAGVVVATFDAELFGHWWAEGIHFIRDVMLSLNADPEVVPDTTMGYLQRTFSDTVVSLPEGSWGEEADHRVWHNEQVDWMWEVEFRCEASFSHAVATLDWRSDAAGGRYGLRDLLEQAGRELLLLQASDWPFVIRRGQAVDYGTRRFIEHVTRFDRLLDLAEKVATDPQHLSTLNEVERHDLADARLHDVVFPKIDLSWWLP